MFIIGLNPVDIDLDSMNHPQISHTQGLISGIFMLLVNASYTATFQKLPNYVPHPVCVDMD